MKKRILKIMACGLLIGLTACGKETKTDSPATIEMVPANETQQADINVESAQPEPDPKSLAESAQAEPNINSDVTPVADSSISEQIKSEVAKISESSDDISAEISAVYDLYEKYDEQRANAPDQASMNESSGLGTLVWKAECESLLERIKENSEDAYNNIISEYEKWESYVPFMAEKMSYIYEGGSIYPMMCSYNEAMRYKYKSFSLASALIDLTGGEYYGFRGNNACGFYGDYDSDSYLLITEGMESDSYNVLIHFDNDKVLSGWGYTDDGPDSDTYILFTSDDGTVEGHITHSMLEAALYVTKTDNAVVGLEGAPTFYNKY